jgi:hypothetical protein
VAPAQNTGLFTRARHIAERIVDINETTRARTETFIKRNLEIGLHPTALAEKLASEMDAFNKTRALTIARTESNRAWTQGTVEAMKEVGTVTHMSIIGCTSREEDRWDSASYQQFMYRGESTCNAQDVPIGDMDGLNFHPNHGGTPVPSRFMEGFE